MGIDVDNYNDENIEVIDFNNNPTELMYTKAKLIDMYGFEKGITK